MQVGRCSRGAPLALCCAVTRAACRCKIHRLKRTDYETRAYAVQGKMIAVLPFVGKILEATKDSKSYRPSNPWVSNMFRSPSEADQHTISFENGIYNLSVAIRNVFWAGTMPTATCRQACEPHA